MGEELVVNRREMRQRIGRNPTYPIAEDQIFDQNWYGIWRGGERNVEESQLWKCTCKDSLAPCGLSNYLSAMRQRERRSRV